MYSYDIPCLSILAVSAAKSSFAASSIPMRAGPKFLFVFLMDWIYTRSSVGPISSLMKERISPDFCGKFTMK